MVDNWGKRMFELSLNSNLFILTTMQNSVSNSIYLKKANFEGA